MIKKGLLKLIIAFAIVIFSINAFAERGGSCSGEGIPINFNVSCSYSVSDGQPLYLFQFEGVSSNDGNAINPLIITKAQLSMDGYIPMAPLAGTPNAFFLSKVSATQNYSFIYYYKLTSGDLIQCETSQYQIAECQKD